ncbi:Protein of unknown function [Actinacidiphila glaucinigra]|uniref:DUF3515 domain-containing protein n=1 Tax=Actinacidiphila glaucinigra TaxID=235986 RepID=A0A239GXP0_9ACTN|nr:Protein of unknown function [Actinacidiphila glaucinigra]
MYRRVALVSVSAVACLSAAAVWISASGTAAGGVAVPSPSASAARMCGALHDALPGKVDGLSKRSVSPVSDLTAGWGDPTVVLRCGVPRPEMLTPGNPVYNPTAEAVEVNGVSWLIEQTGDGYRFTTTGRKAFVEVTVPARYKPEVNPLTDLGHAVETAIPSEL